MRNTHQCLVATSLPSTSTLDTQHSYFSAISVYLAKKKRICDIMNKKLLSLIKLYEHDELMNIFMCVLIQQPETVPLVFHLRALASMCVDGIFPSVFR